MDKTLPCGCEEHDFQGMHFTDIKCDKHKQESVDRYLESKKLKKK